MTMDDISQEFVSYLCYNKHIGKGYVWRVSNTAHLVTFDGHAIQVLDPSAFEVIGDGIEIGKVAAGKRKYFLVHSSHRGPANKQHYNYSEACEEAKRLAKKEGYTFHVLGIQESFSPEFEK